MSTHDAIVVGARCAGSPTAMLLARAGLRVLLLDRSEFPSDTLSTHVVHPRAVASLRRWGLLDRLVASGCPPIDTYTFDLGAGLIAGAPGTVDSPVAYCPRRTVLDAILVDGAVAAGAVLRTRCKVERLLFADDGRVTGVELRSPDGAPLRESARVVIGADGRNSVVAEAVRAPRYHERPPLLAAYYAYWSGLPMQGRFETWSRPPRGFAAAPTHDGLTMVVGGWPYAEFAANKADLEGNYRRMFDRVPEFAQRLAGARLESRILGVPTPNYFRQPFGPGWALVGDAGYLKDPITAQGILDAFRDAQGCAEALVATLGGGAASGASLAAWHSARDADALPMYELTCQLAALQPPPPEMQALLSAIAGNPAAMDGFARMNAGTISPAEFLAPANVGAIMAAAHGAAATASARASA